MDDDAAQRIADELEIRNLIARIAHLTDRGTIEEYMTVYTPDAVWEMTGTSVRGIGNVKTAGYDAIAKGVQDRRDAGVQGPDTNTRHIVNSITVDFPTKDTAKVKAYYQYFTGTNATPSVGAVGAYDVDLKRTSDGWKVVNRLVISG